jgi:hypothetical protein
VESIGRSTILNYWKFFPGECPPGKICKSPVSDDLFGKYYVAVGVDAEDILWVAGVHDQDGLIAPDPIPAQKAILYQLPLCYRLNKTSSSPVNIITINYTISHSRSKSLTTAHATWVTN